MKILIYLRTGLPSVVFCNLCAALMSIILARSISPSLLGTWFIFVLIFSSLETINKLQHDTTFVNFVGKKKINFEDTLPSILAISGVSTFIVLITFFFFKNNIISFFFNENFSIGSFLINFLPLILPLNIIFFNYLNFILIKKINFFYTVQNIFWLIALISILINFYFFKLNVIGALISYYIIPQVICTFICFLIIHRNYEFKLNLNFKKIKKILNYSVKIYFFGLLTIYILNSYRFFGSKILVNETFAFFSLALIISNFVTQPISSALSSIILSKLSNIKSKSYNALKIVQVFRISFFINMLICAISLLFINDLILFFYGEKYDDVFFIYLQIVFGIALLNTSTILATFFITSGDIKTNIKINTYSCIFVTILSLILIPKYEFDGLIMTLILTTIFIFLFRLIVFFKKSKLDIEFLFLNKKDLIEVLHILKIKV